MGVLTAPPTLQAPPKVERQNRLFKILLLLATMASIAVLLALLVDLFVDGAGWIRPHLLTDYGSFRPERAGARAALVGTLWLMITIAVITVPLGIGGALYLEEFAPRNRLTRAIETNIANLAGVPSVVYGLLGLGVFVQAMNMGRILLAGAMTLSLLVLPVVIIASREALRAVPLGIREGAFALGATRWEVVRRQVLPAAVPGMMTGTILALSRAIGETAPLVLLGGVVYITTDPTPFSAFTAMPIQILGWVIESRPGFAQLAAAASIVLLVMLLSMNAVAIWLRNRYRQEW